ncbi:MAG: hypothetical protein QXF26_09640 [Candidatus Bathyarchaeia archaeon]
MIKIEEVEKRITSEISSLRSEVQYASRVAVLETRLVEIEKNLLKHGEQQAKTTYIWRRITTGVK